MVNLAKKTTNYHANWKLIRDKLQNDYGQAIFKSWLSHLDLVEVNGSEVVLAAPTRFIREWIVNNYADTIRKLWIEEDTRISILTILARPRSQKISPISSNIIAGIDVTGQNIGAIDTLDNDDGISSPLDRRYTFDNFVVGESNQLAFESAKVIAENKNILPGKNPLYIYGGVGLGKTHLMHAIAWYIRQNQPQRKVVYLSAEKFMYSFVQALRNKDIMNFKDSFRSVDVLMIDDVQFICGKESTQEEFFHTLNYLLDQNKQVIISGDRSPSELEGLKERVRSRLGWGIVADINKTSYDLRLGILKSKVNQMNNVEMPENVLDFLANKISSNVRELEGALNKVVAHSTLVGKKISLDSTQNILMDLLRSNEKSVTINDIQKKVAEYFGIKVSDLSSSKRSRSIARPRQVAMYLCKKLTVRSLSEIGRKFGGKDHTTVMHAIKKVEELSEQDKEFKEDVNILTSSIMQ